MSVPLSVLNFADVFSGLTDNILLLFPIIIHLPVVYRDGNHVLYQYNYVRHSVSALYVITNGLLIGQYVNSKLLSSY